MPGRKDRWRESERKDPSSLLCYAKCSPQESLRRGGSKTHDQLRMYQLDLRFEPRHTGPDLGRIRLCVNPPLATRLPFEVLDNIGDISSGAIDARFGQSLIEDFSRGPDERMTGKVLVIAGLLPCQQQIGLRETFAEYSLRSTLPERTCLTTSRDFP